MRLLLDEMLAPAIARALRVRGRDVEAVKEHPEWQALSDPDPDLVSLARREQRAIVTANLRDFRPLHAELVSSGAGHAGMVFVPIGFRLSTGETGRIVAALEARLGEYPGDLDLANGAIWLGPVRS